MRFCSVYYTDSVTRINQNCLKKREKKSNKVLFQLWLVSVTVIDGSAIHYAKTRLLTWNFRIEFYDLQRGPPSYLRHSSLFWFNPRVIETRAGDRGYSYVRFLNREEKTGPITLIMELKRSLCLLNLICFIPSLWRHCRTWEIWMRCLRAQAGVWQGKIQLPFNWQHLHPVVNVAWGIFAPVVTVLHRTANFSASHFMIIPLFITVAKQLDILIPPLAKEFSWILEK